MVVKLKVVVGAVVLGLSVSVPLVVTLTPGQGPLAPDVFTIGYNGHSASLHGLAGHGVSTVGGSITGNVLMQVVSDPPNAFCTG